MADIKINCGGGAVAPFTADAYFSGGAAYDYGAATNDTSQVASPPPNNAYNTVRYGDFDYVIPNLIPGGSYRIRLHLCEDIVTGANQRTGNYYINGNQVLTNFDIFASAGGKNKAVVREYVVTPNSSNQIVIGVRNATVAVAVLNALELVEIVPLFVKQPADRFSAVDDWVNKNGMLAWYRPESFAGFGNGQGVTQWNDTSGNGRHLLGGTNSRPIVQTPSINNYASVYFSGNVEPLKFTETLIVKTAIVISSYALATFANYAGLLTDTSSIPVLIGNQGSNLFFNNYSSAGYQYRYAGTVYPSSNQLAPVNNNFQSAFASLDTGFGLNGIQLGQDRTDTSRRWNGRIAEVIFYDRVLTDAERYKIYQYFAAKYRVWEMNSSGLDVFPFPGSWERNISRRKIVAVYQPTSGNRIVRVKRGAKLATPFDASIRLQLELEAARSFWDAHHPTKSFVFRDSALYPPVDTNVWFAPDGEFKESGRLPNSMGYSFDVIEA